VWVEKAELADRSTERRLKVYDRNQEREFELEADPDELDLSDDVVVWQNLGGGENGWDVLAYDLRTGTKLIVIERPGALIRISGSWVVYLESREDSRESGQVDLRAHNLETGEDFLLDQACILGPDGSGTYAISEGRVVWNKCTLTETGWQYQFLGVDLNGPRNEYFVNLPANFYIEGFSGKVLAHRVGSGIELYDLERGEPLEPINALQRGIEDFFISNDQVVWDTGALQDVYTAWIER